MADNARPPDGKGHRDVGVEEKEYTRLEKMQGIFNYFDVDKDGILDSKEFINFVNQLLIPSNEKIEEDQFDELASQFGANPAVGVKLQHFAKIYESGNLDSDFQKLEIPSELVRKKQDSVDSAQEKKTKQGFTLNGVLKEGDIQKRGTFNKTYKQRWMQLERSNGRSFLVYYKSKRDKKPNGQILLEDAEVELDDRNPKNWRVHTNKRCFYLKCENQAARDDWIDSLVTHCAHSLKTPNVKVNKKSSISSSTTGSAPTLAAADSPKNSSPDTPSKA